MKASEFLDQIDSETVSAAIQRAELVCSGEIRVHLEPRLGGRDVMDVAEKTFERLGMTKTEARNGVLIFIAAKEQTFAVLGDRGIHEKVGESFWSSVASELSKQFAEGRFTEGIVCAIDEAGKQLQEHFPYDRDDVNELPNEVSVGPDDADADE